MAQRAKLGYRPCCARPTHAAGPNRYAAGEFSKEKVRGLSQWTGHGPSAARRYAACVFAQSWVYLPRNLDWAAKSLKTAAPPLLGGLSGTVNAKPPPLRIPSTNADDVSNRKVTMNLGEGVPHPDRELLERRRQPGRPTCPPSPSPSTPRVKPTPSSQSDGENSPRSVPPPQAPQPRGRHRDLLKPRSDATRLRGSNHWNVDGIDQPKVLSLNGQNCVLCLSWGPLSEIIPLRGGPG